MITDPKLWRMDKYAPSEISIKPNPESFAIVADFSSETLDGAATSVTNRLPAIRNSHKAVGVTNAGLST